MTDTGIIPRVKIDTQKIYSPISKCGVNWWMEIRVRCPYKNVDVGHRTLPSLGDPSQIELMDSEFLDEIIGDYDRIYLFILDHLHEMNETQRFNAEQMLSRAISYVNDARKIWNLWNLGFSISGYGKIPPWPLTGPPPQDRLDESIGIGHKRDGERWRQLIRAALQNLRCAEELAKKATIRHYNKQVHHRGNPHES